MWKRVKAARNPCLLDAMPAQPALRVTGLRVPARGDQADCSSSYSPQHVLCGTAAPRILLRRVKRPAHSIRFASHAHAASISAVLDDLAGMLPHVTLPRFPPVVRRLVAALQGRDEGEADGACERGLVKRKRADKHTLATRDVHKEDDVIALEVTGGRKRVYKRQQSKHPDGSFEMVQVRARALSLSMCICLSCTPKASTVTCLSCSRHIPYRRAITTALSSSRCITCCRVVHSAQPAARPSNDAAPRCCHLLVRRRQQCTAQQAVPMQEHESSGLALRRLWASFLVPQGYPDSVSPQYTEYMAWRGVQYFFGGALSLFTTRALCPRESSGLLFAVCQRALKIRRIKNGLWGREKTMLLFQWQKCALTLMLGLMLSGCIGNGSSAPIPALGPVNRIEAKTLLRTNNPNRDLRWRDGQKTISNPTQIAQIVALIDAHREEFRDAPGSLTYGGEIELKLYQGTQEQRKIVVVPGGYADEFGKEWNMVAFDAGRWKQGNIDPKEVEKIVAAIGPIAPSPLPTPVKTTKPTPTRR